MRVRRHFPGHLPSLEPEEEARGPEAERSEGPDPRRWARWRGAADRDRGGETGALPPGRRLLWEALAIAGVFGAGYLVASTWLSPVPLVSSDHAVPRVIELPAGAAQRKLAGLGFRVKFDEDRQHPTIPRGAIVWQDPPPGTILPENSTVVLSTSAGGVQVPVPDLAGLAEPQAREVLAAAGLRVGAVDTIVSDADPGTVLTTRPAAGAARDPGTRIDLVVSAPSAAVRAAPPGARVVPLGAGGPPR